MTSLPKLLPTWHDLSVQDIVRKKDNSYNRQLHPPDFGGIGIDINIGAKSPCTISKFYNSQLRFASSKCSLPFFPLKSKHNLREPCLEALEKEKIEFDTFSMRLTHMRNMIATNKNSRAKALTLREKLKNQNQDEETITAPKAIVQLAELLPNRPVVPIFNADYVGGNLGVCNYADKHALVHTNYDNFNELYISPLSDDSNQHFAPDISEQITVKFKDDPILQVDEAIDGFCARQRKSFHLVNVKNLSICSKSVHKAKLYHIAANPYNPTEILSIYEKGVMKLKNMSTKKTIWSMLDNVYNEYKPLYPTWRCAFGSNPFSAVCLNEAEIYSFDFREEKNTVRILFSADNSSFYRDEQLTGLRQWNRNLFQHFITSSHHLTLCDERYLKTPVMLWNHCLKNLPIYLEIADIDSDVSIIAIATQKAPQVASFVCSKQTNVQPVSLSSPLMFSSPSDCIKSLKFHCHYIDDKLSKRFSSPLTGMCVVPSHSEIGFTVFQRTSLGDIFYQDFKQSSVAEERTYHVSTGCVLTPPEKILPHINALLSSTDSDEELANKDEEFIDIFVNIDKILTPPKEISANCMFCRLSNSAEEKKLVISEICPTCNLSKADSEHFTKVMTNESVLIGPSSANTSYIDCDIDYLKKFDDKYSKKVLAVWTEPDEIDGIPETEAEKMSL